MQRTRLAGDDAVASIVVGRSRAGIVEAPVEVDDVRALGGPVGRREEILQTLEAVARLFGPSVALKTRIGHNIGSQATMRIP